MKLKITALLFSILLLCQCDKTNNEISNWRGPDRSGFYPETGLLTEWPKNGPELLWKFKDLGIGYTSPAVTSDKVYITGTIDSISYIFALNHKGKLLWRKEFGLTWKNNYPGVRTTPVIYKGFGYLVSGRGLMVCFDAENGEIKWEKDWIKEYNAIPPYFGFCENLLIDGEKIYCTPGDTITNNILALNRFTGDIIWKSEGVNEISAYASPTIITHNNNRFLVTITEKSIIALNPDNGNLVWSHDLKYPHGIHANIPIYDNGYIFAMNGWGYGSVMMKLSDDDNSVEEVWRSDLFDLEHGDVLKIGNNIYGGSWDKKVFSVVDWETGTVKDSSQLIGPASVVSAEGLIYAYSYSGEVSLVKPLENSFEIISSFKTPGRKNDHIAHPVIHNKRLYIRYANSLLVYSIAAE
ncbi:PQQ-binding-like beta-propeller repeat protein [Bacteroidota bacterium]